MALPFKSDSIVIPSGGAADPKVVTGTADPTSGFSAPEGSIYLRYVASNGQAFVKEGPGDTDWTNLVTAGGTTLDGSYDFGGAGAGRIIVADSGALQVNATTADTQPALILNRSPTAAAAAVGLELTLGANANTSSNGIQINDSGTGTSLYTTKLAAGIAHYTSLQHAGAQAIVIAVNAAPSSAPPVAINANIDGTTATLLSITKIPSSATAGAGIGVSMGGNTTGPGVTISAAGTGPALQVSAGTIEMANASSAAVSPANNGRLRYNSSTQTFQVSLNGAAYVDLATSSSASIDIGDSIGSSTVGSVLFVGAGNVLQQDNVNFFWDDSNNTLQLTSTGTALAVTNTSASAGAMSIRNTNISGPVDFFAIDSAGTARLSWGFGNNSYSDSARQGRGYVWRNTGTNFVFARTGTVDLFLDSSGRLGVGTSTSPDTNSLLHVNSGSSGVGTSNTGSLIVIERSANVYLTIKAPSSNDKGILFANPTSIVDGGIIYDNTSTVRGLQLRTAGNTSRLAITSVGDVIVGTAAAAPTKSFNGPFEVTGDARNVNATLSTYGTGFTSELMLYRGRGTGAATTAVLSGDVLGAVAFAGANSATGVFSGSFVRALATENWGASNVGTELEFYTTTNAAGSGGRLIRMNIEHDGAWTMLNSASAAISVAGEVRLRNSSNRLQVSENGGSYLTVASHASGVITGGVFFGNGSDRLAQDSANFFWDDTNNVLVLGNNATTKTLTAAARLEATKTDAVSMIAISAYGTGQAELNLYRARGTIGSSTAVLSGDILGRVMFHGNAAGGDSNFAGAFFEGIANENWSGSAAGARIDFYTTLNGGTGSNRLRRFTLADDGAWTMLNSAAAAVSAASELRLRYNTTGHKFQVSANAGSYYDVSLLETAFTAGSVPFANSSGRLAQDNANLFWDDSNDRLGLGTAAPDTRLHVAIDAAPVALIERLTTGTSTWLNTLWVQASSSGDMVDEFGPNVLFRAKDTGGTFSLGHISMVRAGADNTGDFVIYPNTAGTPNERLRVVSDGGVQVPGSTAAVSATNTGRIRYTTSGQVFQVSLNGAAYVDLLTTTTGVPQSRTLTAGAGLAGGGDLSADRTFDVGAGTGITVNANDVAVNQATAFAWTAGHTWDPGTSPADALSVLMTAPGVAGQRDSHRIVVRGASFDTGAHTTDWRQYVDITSDAGASKYTWESRIDAGTFTARATLDDAGTFTVNTLVVPGTSGATHINATSTFTGQTNGFPIISGRAIGTYDTTALSLLVAAVWGEFSGSRSAGANDLVGIGVNGVADGAQQNVGVNGQANGAADINYGLAGTAFGGTLNYALFTDQGSVVLNNTSGSTTIKGATTIENQITQKAHASFAGSGFSQTTKAVQTTDATQTHMTAFTIADTFAAWVTVEVVGRGTAGVERAFYGKAALVYREGGGATIQGSVQDIHPDVETSAGLDATITVSGNDVRVSVTGLAATTINWVATVKYQAVSGSA